MKSRFISTLEASRDLPNHAPCASSAAALARERAADAAGEATSILGCCRATL